MKKVYFITNTLPRIHGGRTKSLLQRAKLLNSQGQEITIISTNYNSCYEEIYQYFIDTDKVMKNTSFINIYDYYRKKNTCSHIKKRWENELEQKVGLLSEYVQVLRSRVGDRRYYYRDGKPHFLIKNSEKKHPEYFALYRDWNFNPYIYYLINDEGVIHRVDHFEENNNLKFQEFLTPDGKVYLTREFSNNKKILKIRLKQDEDYIEFPNEKEFICFFFNEIFNDDDVVVNDARFLDIPLLKANVGKRIFQMHNPHLDNPLDSNSKIKGSFSNILNSDFPKTDIIVSLTEKQKMDIMRKVPGLEKNIVVIPHSTTQREIKYNRLSNHFGLICRLHPQKNIKDAIKGFYLFQKEYSEYILDIYGDGESRESLEAFANELGIQNKVVFHGNTQQIDRAYQSLFALLITSDFEGFPLNALESISNGTPIITYEVNYGPTDIVDKNSGWVVTERTPEALKNKMIEAIKNPLKIEEVLKRSLEFSEKNFIQKWEGILK